MNDNRIEEQKDKQGQAPSHLQSKPERQSGRRRLSLILLLVGALVIVGGVVALVIVFSHQSPATTATTATTPTTASSTATTPASSGSGKQSSKCTGARLPFDIVEQETASALHLTVTQVKTQVHAGKTIVQVATAQGFSADQLHTIEVNALQVANNQWLQFGCIKQQDVTSNMQRDTGTSAYMNDEFTQLFQ